MADGRDDPGGKTPLVLALLLLVSTLAAFVFYAQVPSAPRGGATATVTETATATATASGHPFQYYAATSTPTPATR